MNIKITKITIQIGVKEIELTIEEAKQLQKELNTILNTPSYIYTSPYPATVTIGATY